MNIIVIGCGVSGLSSGIRLLEVGHSVTIWARDLPPATTSNIAAAIWHPYKVFPVERAVVWGKRTLETFYELAEVPEAGVRPTQALELFGEPVGDPWWRECLREFRHTREDEMASEYCAGYLFETVVVEMKIYLDYLMRRFKDGGGEINRREVSSMDEALDEADLVVNCAGLGARTLAGDETLYPIRGQIVRISNPPIERIVLDEDEKRGVTYIVPRSNDCILGGTAQVGDWSLEPDEATAQAIIERCARLVPEVREARVLEHLVGLRPGRSAVRLEREETPGGKGIIHNYGHGGAGITLSWGCAEEVVALAGQA